MAANGISTLTIASGTILTKNINPPHSNTEIVAPFSAIWSLNYAGALGATDSVSYKLYVTSLGIGSAFTLTSHSTGDFAVTAGNFLYDEYGTSIGIIKGNATIDNYMAKAAAVCGSLNATIITAATYKGTWNAFTNTPTLTDGVGTLGDAYDNTVAGTSGAYPAYGEQDWRIYDGAVWQRVDKITTTQWTIKPAAGGLADKEARQIAKLDIAELKRKGYTLNADGTIASGPDTTKIFYRVNNTYDLALSPTQYSDDAIVDNANSGGLLNGRPWVNYAGIAFAPNIWRTDYELYFNDTPSFFATAALKAAPNDYNGTDTTISEPTLLNNTSIEYKGYFLATYTGTHTFYLNSDDGSWLWIGPTALTGFTTANALVQNGGLHGLNEVSATISLVAGTYYPIRIQFGNGPEGPGQLFASYAHSGQAKTSTWTGKVFYNTATNGF
jgi:hypothetical protein